LCNFDVFHDHAIFAVKRNFSATLATFVSFQASWIQTLTVVSCDSYLLLFDQYENWPISILLDITTYLRHTHSSLIKNWKSQITASYSS